MKRVGSIYLRDISKSKEKNEQPPLREISNNYNQPYPRRPQNWQSEEESRSQSIYKSTSEEYRDRCFETDSREISFSGSQPSQHKVSRQQNEGQSQVVKKLKCVNSIINEIGALKSCSLKLSQSNKLCEIQDKLLRYQRSLLQNEKQNYS